MISNGGYGGYGGHGGHGGRRIRGGAHDHQHSVQLLHDGDHVSK